ncbi:MAG: dipeptidyl peptidase 3 [bacterium]|nr:dipeptidyl peptidase 3 [bacterium]
MSLLRRSYWLLLLAVVAIACTPPAETDKGDTKETTEGDFNYLSEQFADLKIIRYRIPGFDKLTPKQKELVYYLTQAGLEGRDIMYSQNYRHNLTVRKALENIVKNYSGDKNSEDWGKFMVYTKRIWFSNGIHHHYSNNKIMPEFSREYFNSLLEATNTELASEVADILFDPNLDAKKVNLDPEKGLLAGSAVNFYAPDVTADEVDEFYSKKTNPDPNRPLSHGLNSRLSRDESGNLVEEVYKSGGLYGPAIDKIIGWLEKASGVAENEPQKKALDLLIEYYKTGSLETWDAYNIAWVQATEGDIDYINSFIEVYNDPKGYRGSFESIVEIKDFEASDRMKILSDNVQWFEDNSPIMDEHKKENVVGVTYKVVNVAGEAGDASPSTPIGVNLPNANWIRAEHGSKSVSLGNIVAAYGEAAGSGLLAEFSYTDEEVALSKEHGALSDKLHTALHEVIGHASGKLNPGVGTPKETLKSYASALEEGRADLVALYYLLDPKLIELGLIPSLDVGKEAYDSYIKNGLMMQLRRLEPGEVVEEAHMRNRQMIAKWAFEKGQADNVIERKEKDGKSYFVVNDYDKLRDLFGQLLREVQRVKSEGDYEAGKNLIENYGVQVDQELHAQVLERAEALKSAPYGGFINPVLVPVTDDSGNITDVKVEYPADFTEQMLYYSENYSNL